MKSPALKLSKGMIGLLEKNGITEATPIQREIIPAIFDGRDVIAQSETGSGKTLSFALPLIEQTNRADGTIALILAPTRELAVQIANEFVKFSQGKHLGITPVYGGVSISQQIQKLKKTNFIVATPGRLLDLMNRGAVHLDKIRYLVLDEADRMLDMGFIRDIEKILRQVPAQRQTMLFSATISKEILQLTHKYLKNPKHVKLASTVKPELLRQTYYYSSPEKKLPLLIHLLKHERDLALVFCNRKHITNKLSKQLTNQGVQAKCLHGDMSQNHRERVTADFKHKRFSILVATDVAARGLHIDDITHVYNYEIPRDVESYTHRVGRTARAGKNGEAISLVATEEEKKFFKQILFEYRGSITLKAVDNTVLPQIAEPPKQQQAARQHHGPAHGERSHGNRSHSDRSHGDRFHGKKQGEKRHRNRKRR